MSVFISELIRYMEMTKMENYPLRFSAIGQLYPESMADAKSRFWQTGSPSVSKAEVICPQPRRAIRVPYVLDGLDRFGPKPKGSLPLRRGNHGLEILDVILSKDEFESDSDASNQMGFLCGSPPVRSNNPVVKDVEFAKLTLLSASPMGNLHDKAPRGSPLRASPKVRVEGFACGSPESPRVIQAQA